MITGEVRAFQKLWPDCTIIFVPSPPPKKTHQAATTNGNCWPRYDVVGGPHRWLPIVFDFRFFPWNWRCCVLQSKFLSKSAVHLTSSRVPSVSGQSQKDMQLGFQPLQTLPEMTSIRDYFAAHYFVERVPIWDKHCLPKPYLLRLGSLTCYLQSTSQACEPPLLKLKLVTKCSASYIQGEQRWPFTQFSSVCLLQGGLKGSTPSHLRSLGPYLAGSG